MSRAASAESGGTTFFGTGIEPGFMCDALTLSLSSISRDITSIRAQECLSYATYDQPNYHVSHGGILGAPCDPSYGNAFADHILAAGMGGLALLLADALGVTLEDLTAVVDLAVAEKAFEVAMGPIGKGAVAGCRFGRAARMFPEGSADGSAARSGVTYPCSRPKRHRAGCCVSRERRRALRHRRNPQRRRWHAPPYSSRLQDLSAFTCP
ncbi:dihydrodipicolinate reductase-like protein [Mycobacterium europaeum]|uniref:Dihydrodipicolinate reductase-like protein n=1 Tax=Mycobacterium europaeum TaxID=761804 RepID=A0A0U1DKD8_9MYCO|nr:dihydrodipicolinate reductase-like protein [Mycobacterium europaeum]